MSFLESVKSCGVVGAGGAGFPTHVKLNAKAETLIINGIECEPLLETDKYLMRHYATDLVKGVEEIGELIGATRRVIAVKGKNVKEIEAIEMAIRTLNSDVEIFRTGNFYPAGDEQMLLREVSGVTLVPGQIPLSAGIVVTNVATVLDVFKKTPVTHRLVTVTGAVKNPTLIRVPVGTSIEACIELAGGAIPKAFKVILGGPMMGKPCEQEEINNRFITKTSGGLIVLPEGHVILNRHELPIKAILSRASSACIQCRMCTDLCPRYLNGHPLYPHKVMRSVAAGETQSSACESALLCCECGICEMYACPMGLSPKTINQFVKGELTKNGKKWQNPEDLKLDVHEMRAYRKVPTDRLINRLDLTEYVTHGLETVIDYEPNKVVISLKQHIGAPATPVVNTGDVVSVGTLIASTEDRLGANVHSSINGIVTVNQTHIVIEKR